VLEQGTAEFSWTPPFFFNAHVGSDTHIMRWTLLELERDLDDANFMRIHRSIIVNLDRIQALELQNGG
jgi:two-component system, LytTR family, response regulator